MALESDGACACATKPCKVCGVEKNEASFHWQWTQVNRRRARIRDRTCKLCRAAQKRERDRTRASTRGMPGLSPTAQRFLALRLSGTTSSAPSIEDELELELAGA